jgi:hypothetical protein
LPLAVVAGISIAADGRDAHRNDDWPRFGTDMDMKATFSAGSLIPVFSFRTVARRCRTVRRRERNPLASPGSDVRETVPAKSGGRSALDSHLVGLEIAARRLTVLQQ